MRDPDPLYDEAVRAFLTDPAALTQDQIDRLHAADDALGKRAIHRRQAASLHAAQQRAATDPPDRAAKKAARAEREAERFLDTLLVLMAPHRRRLKALEAQVKDLELRLLEHDVNAAVPRGR